MRYKMIKKNIFIICIALLTPLFYSCSGNEALSGEAVEVRRIYIDKIPLKKPDGSTWDAAASNADVYLQVESNNQMFWTMSTDDRFQDVNSFDYPLRIDLVDSFNTFTINDLDNEVFFKLYDFDNFATDEFMGQTDGVKLRDYATSKPTLIQFTSNDIRIEAELYWY